MFHLINLPSRTPTSFIYFGAAAVIGYFSEDVLAFRWLAYAAALMFVLTGPLGYLAGYLEGWEKNTRGDINSVIRLVMVLGLLGEWACYALVGYWIYQFCLAV